MKAINYLQTIINITDEEYNAVKSYLGETITEIFLNDLIDGERTFEELEYYVYLGQGGKVITVDGEGFFWNRKK